MKERAKRFLVVKIVLCVLVAPVVADAQQGPKSSRVGYLAAISSAADSARFEEFRRGLRDLGHVEGQNIVVDTRYANGQLDRLPALAAELVRLGTDVFVTVGTPATAAAKNAAGGMPIVFLSVTDPVGGGFVETLARPGGNITGFTNIAAVLAGKRLELLKETFPTLARVAVLWEPQNPGSVPQWQDSERPARELGLKLHSIGIGRADKLAQAFADLPKTGNKAIVVTLTPMTASNQQRIAALAIREHAPTMCPDRTFANAGCLMSYGPTFASVGRDVARQVDKILKGTKPAELPVEQPTAFELVINLKTARALDIKIPPAVLSRADQILD